MVAAATAVDNGATVIVLEKMAMLGGNTNDGVTSLFRITAKFGDLLFQGKAIVVSDPAIEIGFHRVVPPYTATCSGA